MASRMANGSSEVYLGSHKLPAGPSLLSLQLFQFRLQPRPHALRVFACLKCATTEYTL